MQQENLTISDLEQQTGIPRRTIHFYTAQGLIPPPAGAGGGARYSEVHLLRLKLIRKYQGAYVKLYGVNFKLSGIGKMLDGMSVAEMRKLAEGPLPSPEAMRATIDRWLGAGDRPRPAAAETRAARSRQDEPVEAYLRAQERPQARAGAPSWARIDLADGLELHVRSDRAAKLEALVEAIERLAAKVS